MNILVAGLRQQTLPSALWIAMHSSLYMCHRAWDTAIKTSFKNQKQMLGHDFLVWEECTHDFSLYKQKLVEEMEAMNMSRASV